MKRILIAFVWFVVFGFGGLVLGGAVAGAIAGSQVDATTFAEAGTKGEKAGRAAGAEFGRKYGGIVWLGALVLVIAGAATGVLPGTAKKPSD